MRTMSLSFGVLAVLILCPIPASPQTPDSLPQLGATRLEPEPYLPTAVEGFQRTSMSGLSERDLARFYGLLTARESRWVKSRPVSKVDTVVVITGAFVFDSVPYARRAVQDFRRIGELVDGTISQGRDTVAGLPVFTVHEEKAGIRSTRANYGIGYYQGILGIQVLAFRESEGVEDLRDAGSEARIAHDSVRAAALRAFRAIADKARSQP